MLVIAAGGALSAVAADPTTVLIGQFVVGFGIGIDFPVSGAYVAEFMPKSARGRMIVATIAFQSVGILVAAGVAMAGLTVLDQVGAWRAFFAEAVLAGIIFLCRLSLPESARWNMSGGRNAEAAEAIARILPSERTKLEQLAATAGTTVHNVSKLPQETRTMTVGMLILLFATLQQGGPAQHASLVLVGFIPFNLLMNLGPNATTFTMPPELFPTQMRASASGFAGSVTKLGATVGIFFLPALKADFGIPAVLGLMAIVSLPRLGVTRFFGEEVNREKKNTTSRQRAASVQQPGMLCHGRYTLRMKDDSTSKGESGSCMRSYLYDLIWMVAQNLIKLVVYKGLELRRTSPDAVPLPSEATIGLPRRPVPRPSATGCGRLNRGGNGFELPEETDGPTGEQSPARRYRPGVHPGKHASHETALPEMEQYRQKLGYLQHLLYAERKHALLIVLQGLDAGGKDGVVHHVISAMNPQGCTVSGLNRPVKWV